MIEQIVDYYTDGSSALALPKTRDESKIIPFPSPGASSSQKLGPDVATAPDKASELPTRKPGQYFGAEINNNGYICFITEPMNFDTTISWINSQACFGHRPAGDLWGIYTLSEKDAKNLANYFNDVRPYGLSYHEAHTGSDKKHPPFFDHYHLDHGLYGYFTKFHFWYGVAQY